MSLQSAGLVFLEKLQNDAMGGPFFAMSAPHALKLAQCTTALSNFLDKDMQQMTKTHITFIHTYKPALQLKEKMETYVKDPKSLTVDECIAEGTRFKVLLDKLATGKAACAKLTIVKPEIDPIVEASKSLKVEVANNL